MSFASKVLYGRPAPVKSPLEKSNNYKNINQRKATKEAQRSTFGAFSSLFA